ncbi:phosphotransferase [Actinopolymorpha sp. B9G3]|uniref:phosphotransferase family protein n=1 Tax=Actinopolymorpha sp. B9G3 TaxID=3158970 RepID=UPI0032D98650
MVEREAYVHDLLRRNEVPVAPLLGWGRAEGPGGHSWMLFERVEHDDATELTAASSRALVEVLRRIHEVRATPQMKAIIGTETTPCAMAARVEARVRALADRVGVTDSETIIGASLEILRDREATVEPRLTHMDMRVENLCFRGGELVAVLDLSNCTTGDPAADLGRMSAYGSLTSPLLAAYAGDTPLDLVLVAAYAVDTYALLGLLKADEFADQNLVDRGVGGLCECLAVFRAHGLA